MDDDPGPTDAISVAKGTRGSSKTKDRNAESFWVSMEETKLACKAKAENPKWGKRRISQHLATMELTVSDPKVQQYVDKFLYDMESNQLYVKSTELNVSHRTCVTKDALVNLIIADHARDHRQAETIYESLCCSYYPVVRENIKVLFKQHVNCVLCRKQQPLQKTSLAQKTILATYPNSRWQMDQNKLPACRGFQYACNIVDCF